MTDPVRRRLVRMAASMNARATRCGAQGHIEFMDLYTVMFRGGSDSCFYCGIGLEPMHGSFDHAIALDRGGSNRTNNIVRCCLTCQRSKHTKTPGEFRSSQDLSVTCALPGCGKSWNPRWGEYKRGMARFCSRSHAAKSRWV